LCEHRLGKRERERERERERPGKADGRARLISGHCEGKAQERGGKRGQARLIRGQASLRPRLTRGGG
jgi:hypothetical protein